MHKILAAIGVLLATPVLAQTPTPLTHFTPGAGPNAGLVSTTSLNRMVDQVNNLTGNGTAQNVVGTRIYAGNGTVALPSFTFSSDTDVGLYRIGANNIGVAVAGAKVLDISATGLGITGTTLSGDGTVALPGFSFSSDTDTGIYRIGANNIGIAANGAKVLDISATGLGVTGTTLSGDGTVSLPGFAFGSDTDSGMYRIGANNIGFAVNGAKVFDINTVGMNIAGSTVVTSALSTCLTVGPNGATNPALQVVCNTPSAATGLTVTSAAAAGGLALAVISSGTDENLTLNAKGAGTVTINGTATGGITLGRAINVANHVNTGSTAPALTSCGGGSPTITGSDTAGIVTMGTTATGCVITFATAYTGTPYCVVSWIANPLAAQSYVTSNVAITTTQTSTSGNKLQYVCVGPSGG